MLDTTIIIDDFEDCSDALCPFFFTSVLWFPCSPVQVLYIPWLLFSALSKLSFIRVFILHAGNVLAFIYSRDTVFHLPLHALAIYLDVYSVCCNPYCDTPR